MNIILNGKQMLFQGQTVTELLTLCDISTTGIAVAVNGKIIRRGSFDSYILGEGDSVTIITATYGG